MWMSEPSTIPFVGVRLRYDSEKTIDDVVTAILADVGDEPIPIDDIARQLGSWDA